MIDQYSGDGHNEVGDFTLMQAFHMALSKSKCCHEEHDDTKGNADNDLFRYRMI